jgi:hypothetical protein
MNTLQMSCQGVALSDKTYEDLLKKHAGGAAAGFSIDSFLQLYAARVLWVLRSLKLLLC